MSLVHCYTWGPLRSFKVPKPIEQQLSSLSKAFRNTTLRTILLPLFQDNTPDLAILQVNKIQSNTYLRGHNLSNNLSISLLYVYQVHFSTQPSYTHTEYAVGKSDKNISASAVLLLNDSQQQPSANMHDCGLVNNILTFYTNTNQCTYISGPQSYKESRTKNSDMEV